MGKHGVNAWQYVQGKVSYKSRGRNKAA